MAWIIALIGFAGGTARTTVAIHLARWLGWCGSRVLLFDNDHGAALTRLILGGGATEGLPEGRGTDACYGARSSRPDRSIIRSTRYKGVDLVPTSSHLGRYEAFCRPAESPPHPGPRRFLEGVREHYDYVFIDCPPRLGSLTEAALAAADGAIVLVNADHEAEPGIVAALEVVNRVRGTLNPALRELGILITFRQQGRSAAERWEPQLRNLCRGLAFKTTLPNITGFQEIPGQTVNPRPRRMNEARDPMPFIQDLWAEVVARRESGVGDWPAGEFGGTFLSIGEPRVQAEWRTDEVNPSTTTPVSRRRHRRSVLPPGYRPLGPWPSVLPR